MQAFVFWMHSDSCRLLPGTVLKKRRVHLVLANFSTWNIVQSPGTVGLRVFVCIRCVECVGSVLRPLPEIVEGLIDISEKESIRKRFVSIDTNLRAIVIDTYTAATNLNRYKSLVNKGLPTGHDHPS